MISKFKLTPDVQSEKCYIIVPSPEPNILGVEFVGSVVVFLILSFKSLDLYVVNMISNSLNVLNLKNFTVLSLLLHG